MNWVFKSGDHFQVDNNSQKAVVTIVQKRNFTGEVGEHVLVLEKRKQEWEFTALYQIADLEVKNQDGEYKQTTIYLDLVQEFNDKKLLEDYIYSLRRITNYANPIKHFSRKYSRLYEAEFDAIVEDKIYLKRTILGTVLNAMHSEHQKSFIAYIATEAPEILVGKSDLEKALRLLLLYLEFSIVTPAQYLRESANILQSIVTEEEMDKIGFGLSVENLSSRNAQMIKQQVDVINDYIGNIFGFNNENVGLQLIELDDNPKLKALFKNSPLPMTLN